MVLGHTAHPFSINQFLANLAFGCPFHLLVPRIRQPASSQEDLCVNQISLYACHMLNLPGFSTIHYCCSKERRVRSISTSPMTCRRRSVAALLPSSGSTSRIYTLRVSSPRSMSKVITSFQTGLLEKTVSLVASRFPSIEVRTWALAVLPKAGLSSLASTRCTDRILYFIICNSGNAGCLL